MIAIPSGNAPPPLLRVQPTVPNTTTNNVRATSLADRVAASLVRGCEVPSSCSNFFKNFVVLLFIGSLPVATFCSIKIGLILCGAKSGYAIIALVLIIVVFALWLVIIAFVQLGQYMKMGASGMIDDTAVRVRIFTYYFYYSLSLYGGVFFDVPGFHENGYNIMPFVQTQFGCIIFAYLFAWNMMTPEAIKRR